MLLPLANSSAKVELAAPKVSTATVSVSLTHSLLNARLNWKEHRKERKREGPTLLLLLVLEGTC